MKKQLRLAVEGEKKQLESYGMKVEVSTTKTRGPQKPKPKP